MVCHAPKNVLAQGTRNRGPLAAKFEISRYGLEFMLRLFGLFLSRGILLAVWR